MLLDGECVGRDPNKCILLFAVTELRYKGRNECKRGMLEYVFGVEEEAL